MQTEIAKNSIVTHMISTGPYLEICSFQWEKDSHGLFDYQSKKFTKKQYHIKESCKMLRSQAGIILESLKAQISSAGNEIFHIFAEIHNRQAIYMMQRAPLQDTENQSLTPYVVVRSLKGKNSSTQKGYPLRQGDIIKLGRIKYFVHEYRDNAKTHSSGKILLFNNEDTPAYQASYEPCEGICKICYDVQTETNIFIQPCKCKGSCSYVHLSCLKKWIQNKISKYPNTCSIMYNFSKFQCEICQHPYPSKVELNKTEISMIEIQKPKKPYIMLQSIMQGRYDEERVVYLVRVPEGNRSIRLGRAQTCQIRMSDISVSRSHACIRYINKQFHLFDNSSKFGTLVKMNSSVVFGYDLIAIQIGRTVVSMSMRNRIIEQGNKDNDE